MLNLIVSNVRKTNILVISLGIKTKCEFTKGSNIFNRLVAMVLKYLMMKNEKNLLLQRYSLEL